MSTATPARFRPYLICALLFAVTVADYWPVRYFGFVNYDDNVYVYKNPRVLGGLTWPDIRWAFSTFHTNNFIPLTWISLQLDASLFHASPGGLHAENVLIHSCTVVLLFLFLLRATACLWASAIVAAIFALHPTHVESVAWIAERKDVLSLLFFVLASHAYLFYVMARPGKAARWYLALLLLFGIGLLCKSMLVTFPFLLLLIDWWPLNRLAPAHLPDGPRKFGTTTLRRAIVEKIPLFLLAVVSSILTSAAQASITASLQSIPLDLRAENAIVSYAQYVFKTFWPVDLAVLYPYRWHISTVEVLLSAGFILGLTIWSCWSPRRRPFQVVGWLWFVGTLVPVIGVVQVGAQGMADRYLYLPSIGLSILIVWRLRPLASRLGRSITTIAVIAVLLTLFVLTRRQVNYWVDTDHLFNHMSVVVNGPAISEVQLGYTAEKNGDEAAAEQHFRRALALQPGNYAACFNLGNLLLKTHPDQSIAWYQTAAQTDPMQPDLHDNWGVALMKQQHYAQAFEHFKLAESLAPESYEPHYNLGQLYLIARDKAHASAQFTLALHARPNDPAAINGLELSK
jgi:tetratricopeptide (TPR) repeat protein